MKFNRTSSLPRVSWRKRRLHLESLERRRLLAANCQPLGAPLEIASEQVAQQVSQHQQVATQAEAEDVRADLIEPVRHDFAPQYFAPQRHGPDLIQEVGNKLFVVDRFAGDSNLHIFERTTNGELEEIESVSLDFHVLKMVATEDRVVVIGNRADFDIRLPPETNGDHADGRDLDRVDNSSILVEDLSIPYPTPANTVAVTVNLGDEVEVIRQEFVGGASAIHELEGELLIVSTSYSDAVIAIFPPPPMTGLVTRYEITSDGLQATGATEIAFPGNSYVHSGDLYVTHQSDPYILYYLNLPEGVQDPGDLAPSITTVTRYALGDDITEVDSLELTGGYLSDFQISDDGLSAVAIRSLYAGVGPVTVVDLINLSDDQIELFESVELPDVSGKLVALGSGHAVVQDYQNNSLQTINLDQSIDLAAENRIREIDVSNYTVHHNAAQYTEDRFVLTAENIPPGAESLVAPDTIALTVSISDAAVVARSEPIDGHVNSYDPIQVIDRESQRVGLYVESSSADGRLERRFAFGHLREDALRFDGAIEITVREGNRWLETDADAERLIVRQPHRIVEYRWDSPSDPIVTPLGEDEFPIEAVNDDFVVHDNGDDHFLDVLDNDNIQHPNRFPLHAEIVELVGAPEGAEIVNGRKIRLPADAIAEVDSLRFEYVISNGISSSTAVVEVKVLRFSEADVERVIHAIREQAAEDLGTEVEEVDITSIERIFDQPLPVVLPDGQEFDLSPGILVTLTTPDSTALYAASMEGEIIQVFASRRIILAELGLRATNQDGAAIDQVTVGETFWLEFTAKDLRSFGLGVYAAFFDLIVPVEQLVVQGPVEFGPGFTSIPEGGFGPDEIDDLGAISNEIDAPGNELQVVLRIAVEAVAPGTVTLTPEMADALGTETLLRGESSETPDHQVRYSSLNLEIVEEPAGDPLDADGSGKVSAADALVVINFLGRFGTTSLDGLVERVQNANGEGEENNETDIDRMRRFDTNRSGFISALDALVVINELRTQDLLADIDSDDDAEGESISSSALDTGLGNLF